MRDQLFVMRNNHTSGCGTPPVYTNQEPGCYYGYFENPYGEQWVFVYDRATESGELRGGDPGWERVFEVRNGRVSGLMLEQTEIEWLRACWRAATAGKAEQGAAPAARKDARR